LDVLVLGKLFVPGCTVTGKRSLKFVPFLGWFMYLSGTFFLDRNKSSTARKVLDSALASLKAQERALFIFPEGTRSASQKLEFLPFKKGAFHLAKQAGIPVIPVVVSNTSTLFNAKNKIFNTGEIILEVLPPMETTDLVTNDDVSAFTLKVRETMLESYLKLGFSKVNGQKDEPEQPEVEASDIDTDTDAEIVSETTPLVAAD
jgi:1-acyl-sn-glycerol-3-phosphate acyltransferase